jgi:hypothetical protein
MHRTVRTSPRSAARALAWAAVPVLLAAGCTGSPSSSDGGSEDTQDNAQQPTRSPSPEPVRFAALPEPCSTLREGTINDVVPEADPRRGETLESTDTSASGACLWSGLDGYQFRSLTVSLRRFDSDVTIGSGDERAEEYVTQMVEEITGDDANTDVDESQLAEPDAGATSIAYNVARETEGDEQDYRQQRVVTRTGNVVVTVDYAGAGFENADMPRAQSVKENAETAALEVVNAVDASEGEQSEQSGESGEPNAEDKGDI